MTTTMNLSPELVLLDQQFADETAAITAAGQLLVDHGYVEAGYIDSMQERHALSTVYIGNHVAMPHGTESAKSQVKKTGLSILQVPQGVAFGTEQARLVIGIAGVGDEHLELLSNIAVICSDEENVERIVAATSKEEIIALLTAEV